MLSTKSILNKKNIQTCLLSLCLFFTYNAKAELVSNLSVDLRANAMGNAVTADPPGISAIHYNPAGLIKIEGLQTDAHLLVASLDLKSEFSAPPNFNIFGYNDDELVCTDAPSDGERLCSNFKVARSQNEGANLYIPVLDKNLKTSNGIPLVAPFGGIAYKEPGSRVAYGTAFYVPMFGGYHRATEAPDSYFAQALVAQRLAYFTPTVAYEVDNHLSIGGGVVLADQVIGLDTKLRFPNEIFGVLRTLTDDVCAPFKGQSNIVSDLLLLGLCNTKSPIGPFDQFARLSMLMQDQLSPSYNLGVLWEPTDDFAFGASYQSAAKLNMKGKFRIDYSKGFQELINGMNSSMTGQVAAQILGFPSFAPMSQTGLVSLKSVYPAHYQMGIKVKPTERWKVNFDVGYSDYGQWDKWQINFDRPITAFQVAKLLSSNISTTSLSLPLGFQSTWNWGIGTEYALTDRLKVRLGYEPRTSAIPDDKRNTLLPLNNARLYGTGISYKWDKQTTVDLNVSYFESQDYIPANSSSLANNTGLGNLVLNPYGGLDVKTKTAVTLAGITYSKRW